MERIFNVTAYGAVPNAPELQTKNLQDAIDAVGTDAGYADMARQDGMAAEGEIIFYDIGD